MGRGIDASRPSFSSLYTDPLPCDTFSVLAYNPPGAASPTESRCEYEYDPELRDANDCRGSWSLITDILGEAGGDDNEIDFCEAVSPSSVNIPESLETFLEWVLTFNVADGGGTSGVEKDIERFQDGGEEST